METKTLPAGTTQEQWDRYYEDLKCHEKRVIDTTPNGRNYNTIAEFRKAISEWEMMRSCDAPNKPGYYRANND
jgi:hypothetical protein